MSYVADMRKGGYWPMQHHSFPTQGIALDLRSVRKGIRIKSRMIDPGQHGHYVVDKRETVGDVLGPVLWPHKKTKREIPAWWYAAPGAIEKLPTGKINIKALPFGDRKFERDRRFDFLRSHISCEFPRLPKGFHGLTVSAVKETAQEELFMPADPRIISANIAGEGKYGSVVCDLLPDNRIDLDRTARVQTFWRVIRPRIGCIPLTVIDSTAPKECPPGRKIDKTLNSIAWQLGRTGREDMPGLGFCYDLETNPPNSIVEQENKELVNPTVLLSSLAPVAVIGCAGVKASGPLAVGLRDDQHKIGITKDGEPINALHVQTEAYFLRDKLRDGPLDFEDHLFINVPSAPALQQGHLRFDPDEKHGFICGERDGKWKIQVESVFEIPEIITPRFPGDRPPIVTPGRNAPRKNGQPHEAYGGTTIQTAVPKIIFQAQSPDRGSLNFRTTENVDREDVETIQSRAPMTLAIEAWGHYVEDKPQYTETPCTGRYRPGTASGGIIITPPEVDLNDVGTGFDPSDTPLSEAFVVFPKNSNLAFATPDIGSGNVVTGHTISTDNAGTTTVCAVDSDGLCTDIMTWTPTGVSITGELGLDGFSAGSILYVGAGPVLAEDTINLVWDGSAIRTARVDIGFGSGSVLSPDTLNVQGDEKLYHASAGGQRIISTARSAVAGQGDNAVKLKITADKGASSNTSPGGLGGQIDILGGTGGAQLNVGDGGDGGAIVITGGSGGTATSGAGGTGGAIVIVAGAAGGGTSAVNGADVQINSSAGSLGGTDGDTKIGNLSGGVRIGRSGMDTLVIDRLLVNTSVNLPTAGAFTKFQVAADAGTTGAVAVLGNNEVADALSFILTNGSGSTQLFIAGNVNDFIPGTAVGDGGMRVNVGQDLFLGDSGLARLILRSSGDIILPNNVAIGSLVAPTIPLDVTGDAAFSGKAAIGTTVSSANTLRLVDTLLNNSDVGISGSFTFDGLFGSSTVAGALVSLKNTSTKTNQTITGLIGSATNTSSSGSVLAMTGLQAVVDNDSPAGGVVTDSYGIQSKIGVALYRSTRATGMRIENFGALGTTVRGLWIAKQTGATTNWAIASEGGDSYHDGSLRLGSTVAPSEKLDVTGNIKLSGELMGCRAVFAGATNDDVSAGRYLEFIDGITMQATLGYRMLRAGSITGAGQQFNVTVGGNKVTIITQARINGTNVFTTSKTMGSSTGIDGSSDTQARGTDTFVAGDILTLYVNIIFFTTAPTITDICSYVEVVYDT